MAGPSVLTLDYNAVLSSTLFNYRKKYENVVGLSNALLYYLMKKDEFGWQGLSSIGDRAAIPLMYAVAAADSYYGYDVLPVQPVDGLTMAFFDWCQAAVPVSISGIEELKNEGEERLFSLIQTKVQQSELGIKDFFSKAMIYGAGGSNITTPYTSPSNGSVFIDPLPKLVNYSPTSALVVGNIDQATNAWWRNKVKDSTATSYAEFRAEMRDLYYQCSKGQGGPPNLLVCDLNVFELYERALEAFHQNPSYQKADIPFDNVLFKGKPLVWDEYIPNVKDGSETQSASKGTLFMLNTKFIQVQYHKRRNFVPTNMQKPDNQDARVSHVLWLGAMLVSNRAKQGVHGNINTAIAA